MCSRIDPPHYYDAWLDGMNEQIRRQWEELSDTGYDDAMREYIAVVDRIVPGWDQDAWEYPVANQEKFWQDDAAAEQCQYCGVHFSLQLRRHHCRMCFDIFCLECCNASLEMALCPGAPIRMQRVCCQCFQDAERNKSLLEVRRVIRENHDMEQQIKEIQVSTESLIASKQREASKLRQEALVNGCDMSALEAAIQKKLGANSSSSGSSLLIHRTNSGASSAAMHVKTPPAHKFTPRETIEANDQLALANRQLLMGLKVAQCRSKKAIENMDTTLSVLREAICFGASNWNVVLRASCPFLTLSDVKALLRVSKGLHASVERAQCEKKCILEQDLPAKIRPAVWQAACLKNEKTRMYMSDLAEEIRTRFDSSDSETEDSDSNESASYPVPPATPTTPTRPLWLSLLSSSSSSEEEPPIQQETVWKRVYDMILSRCQQSSPAMEFDAQIQSDAQRTFGVSALRKTNVKRYQRASVTTPPDSREEPMETRRAALVNVLRAFSSVNTEIGYCQGMDHVTAVILSVVDWNESKAFWLLTSLVACPKYELDALYAPGIPHLNLRCFQLEKVMATHLPELSAYLSDLEFPISMFATRYR